MNATVTFKAPKVNPIVEFTVKKEFTLNVPNYEDRTVLDLFQTDQIFRFFHNEGGPALVNLQLPDTDKTKEYFFLDGVPIFDEEKIKRMKHNKAFSDEMDTVLNDSK